MDGSQYPWYLLALIPVIAGTIGWFTNVLAVKMMFYPANFVGIRRPFGWQGLIPMYAVSLAKGFHKLISTQLLHLKELYREEEIDVLLEAQESELRSKVRAIIDKQANTHFKQMWEGLSEATREMVYDMAFKEVRASTKRILSQLIGDIETFIDLEKMATDAARANRKLMASIFARVGRDEFKFIERSGLYFGFLFGLVQLTIWIIYPIWWVLPFFGFSVGYATNWVALKLVFEPREPRRILGVEVQGVFHKRQQQVSTDFANLVTEHILTDDALFEHMTRDSAKELILSMVREESNELLNRYRQHPVAKGLITDELVEQIEGGVVSEIEAELLRPDGLLGAIAKKSRPMRETLKTRMEALDPETFEGVLRPAFQKDEWKLIVAGAVLGFGAGTLQLIYIFGEALVNYV